MRLLVKIVVSKDQCFLFDCNLYLRSVGAGEETYDCDCDCDCDCDSACECEAVLQVFWLSKVGLALWLVTRQESRVRHFRGLPYLITFLCGVYVQCL